MQKVALLSFFAHRQPLSSLAKLCFHYKPHQQRHLIGQNEGLLAWTRSFSSSALLLKKKEKPQRQPGVGAETIAFKNGGSSEDPYDFSQLQDNIATAVSRLKDDLSKIRVGGRFNTECIEVLRIGLSKGSKETLKLQELAQVVPKGGRMVTVLASEEEHVKAIASAIVSSNLSLTPQADAHNPLQLNIPIPPLTKESRDQAVVNAKIAMERAAGVVRESRGVLHKRLQDMQKRKVARPDDTRKAQEQMEKVTEKGQKEIKSLYEAAKKTMERT